MLNMKVTQSMNGRAVRDKILQGFKVSKYTKGGGGLKCSPDNVGMGLPINSVPNLSKPS